MAELVAEKLAAFLATQSVRPWQPGTVDCCLFLADWAVWIGHRDPAAHLRGMYDSDDGFRAIIAAHQGVVPVVSQCVANINGKRVQRPSCGSVGVIGSPANINRQWGAIFDGERWLIRFRDEVGPIVARPLAIWKI
ncbi:DUF6950 family protein [Rhizobium grahamii]|uniref:DUF6950 domain-containing protein n=1 Tax=Rhizobium grahamii CCGE 502 TaxID=990285 RepID=S3HKP0_9HYPH|nr:hypothetical protein [Rhizobium grahamii]EPE98620.1 hypothetical protein RGCCGE502_09345 [Rhizobium grahamii CCGE 502]